MGTCLVEVNFKLIDIEIKITCFHYCFGLDNDSYQQVNTKKALSQYDINLMDILRLL